MQSDQFVFQVLCLTTASVFVIQGHPTVLLMFRKPAPIYLFIYFDSVAVQVSTVRCLPIIGSVCDGELRKGQCGISFRMDERLYDSSHDAFIAYCSTASAVRTVILPGFDCE